MKSKKNKRVSISGNYFFVCYRITLCIILVNSLAFSIADRVYDITCWPTGYEDIVGVSSQIITAIISLVVSIIGIAISLQNEEFFGVKITKLYALRANKHYSILAIILIAISLCVLNLIFYMLGLTIAAIGASIVSLLFLLQVIYAEVPIMSKQEAALLRILKDNLIACYLKGTEASKDLKDSIKYLLYTKNLKVMYSYFKDKSDDVFNEYVAFKLLEFQHDLAFELKDAYSDSDQRAIGSSLLENVFDMILQNVDISNKIYFDVSKNKHLLTRVLFRVYELPSMQAHFLEKMSGLFQYLSFNSPDRHAQNELISDTIIILAAETIKNGDLKIVEAIRHQLSNSDYCLTKSSSALNVFTVLSMYLYYLSCSEPDVPSTIKNEIKTFVEKGNYIEGKTRIKSWKNLFAKTAYEFSVDYNEFILLAMKNADVLEYYLYGNGAKFVVLTQSYISTWYLTHLLNTRRIYKIDFSSLVTNYPKLRPHLKNFGDRCLDDNKQFVPTDEMNQIIEFYDCRINNFTIFKRYEDHNHEFFNFINGLKYEELKSDSALAASVNNAELASKIHHNIVTAIEKEWGFDAQLLINNDNRYFSVLFEKTPDAVNFEEFIIDYCINSVRADLKNALKKTILYNDDKFEEGIQKILSKHPQYITESAKEIIPNFYIKDEQVKQKYIDVCGHLPVFQSNILGEDTIVLNDGFRFNCKIDKVEFRELKETELSEQAAKYQRADGQFVFNGVFLPQEEILKIIKAKYTVLTIIIRHIVVSSENKIFELYPYLMSPED